MPRFRRRSARSGPWASPVLVTNAGCPRSLRRVIAKSGSSAIGEVDADRTLHGTRPVWRRRPSRRSPSSKTALSYPAPAGSRPGSRRPALRTPAGCGGSSVLVVLAGDRRGSPMSTTRPRSSSIARSQKRSTAPMSWVTNRIVRPACLQSGELVEALLLESASPTASTSSISRISASTWIAVAKASRTCMPDE